VSRLLFPSFSLFIKASTYWSQGKKASTILIQEHPRIIQEKKGKLTKQQKNLLTQYKELLPPAIGIRPGQN
jgi:hypothetical protein